MWNAISNSAWQHTVSGVPASRRDTREKEGATNGNRSTFRAASAYETVSDFSYEEIALNALYQPVTTDDYFHV